MFGDPVGGQLDFTASAVTKLLTHACSNKFHLFTLLEHAPGGRVCTVVFAGGVGVLRTAHLGDLSSHACTHHFTNMSSQEVVRICPVLDVEIWRSDFKRPTLFTIFSVSVKGTSLNLTVWYAAIDSLFKKSEPIFPLCKINFRTSQRVSIAYFQGTIRLQSVPKRLHENGKSYRNSELSDVTTEFVSSSCLRKRRFIAPFFLD